ncbi:MAG: helix-turn-helix domain-containing protein, partial [Chloroflexota bacterium]|nr:helix-turn-helix domain-containing protein [Chloroflexota bacterium]
MDPMAPVFRALSDPSRRLLLDRLFERDGQTLGELCGYLPGMTRFGVMRHLGVLEEADLVSTRKVGREKRHYLNPIPIRLAHDRWISKYAEPVLGAMSAMKDHLEGRTMSAPDHVYSVYIKAEPERVWRAITDGVETEQYYYGTRVGSDWKPGSPITYEYPDGKVAADG